MKRIKNVLSLFLAAVLVLCLMPLQVHAEDDSAMLQKARQGVVQIYGLGYDRKGRPESSWTGTGFAVGVAGEDSDVFLTNWHVVTASGKYSTDKCRIWIMLDNAQLKKNYEPEADKSIECEVLYTTTGYPDLAVIRVLESSKGFKALPLRSSEGILAGTRVYALGYPGIVDMVSETNAGVEDVTITSGIVSKHMTMSDTAGTKVLLHDAQIQHGNSGGPLVTSEGAAIGLNTYGLGQDESMEYSCAVYIDYAMSALDDLGIHYDVYTPEAPKPTTEPTKPAEKPEPEEEPDEPEHEDKDEGLSTGAILAIVGGAVVLLAVILIAVLMLQGRKRRSVPVPAYQPPMVPPMQPPMNRPQPPYPPERPNFQPVDTAALNPVRQPVSLTVKAPDGTIYPIRGNATIGRDPGCSICLPATTQGVSRRHCSLEEHGGVLYLVDLGSTYGTFVRGQKLQPQTPVELQKGMTFCLGADANLFTIC